MTNATQLSQSPGHSGSLNIEKESISINNSGLSIGANNRLKIF
jgi:hypothetical protein